MDIDATQWLHHRVYDRDGELLGVVVGVHGCPATGQPVWLAIGMGAYGVGTAIAPARGVRAWGRDLVVAADRATILAAPPPAGCLADALVDDGAWRAHYDRADAGHRSTTSP